jgi:SNF2 family DNA or RNA helicase
MCSKDHVSAAIFMLFMFHVSGCNILVVQYKQQKYCSRRHVFLNSSFHEDDGSTEALVCLGVQKQPVMARSKSGIKKNSILHRISAVQEFQSSTKIEALREELHSMLARDPAAKAIVFSQFTSMLDLIYFRLTQVFFLVC